VLENEQIEAREGPETMSNELTGRPEKASTPICGTEGL